MSKIQTLNHSDINAIKALLSSFKLPFADLEIASIHFWGIKNNDILIATGALEIYDSNAILRSVAVKRDFQKLGYGKLITQYLENEATKKGIKNSYLLTTTAESFFRKLNYTITEREQCPIQIKSSQEYAELCPESAICLFKSTDI